MAFNIKPLETTLSYLSILVSACPLSPPVCEYLQFHCHPCPPPCRYNPLFSLPKEMEIARQARRSGSIYFAILPCRSYHSPTVNSELCNWLVCSRAADSLPRSSEGGAAFLRQPGSSTSVLTLARSPISVELEGTGILCLPVVWSNTNKRLCWALFWNEGLVRLARFAFTSRMQPRRQSLFSPAPFL